MCKAGTVNGQNRRYISRYLGGGSSAADYEVFCKMEARSQSDGTRSYVWRSIGSPRRASSEALNLQPCQLFSPSPPHLLCHPLCRWHDICSTLIFARQAFMRLRWLLWNARKFWLLVALLLACEPGCLVCLKQCSANHHHRRPYHL